ncbi:MAG: hypothetical protein AB1815_11210 [Bacillota bacterium]
MKLKVVSSIISILVVVLTGAVLLLAGGPHHTYAFVTSGQDCGLRVEVAPDYVDVTNLNPGDNKNSYLTVHNDGASRLTYYFDIVKTGGIKGYYRGLTGGDLDEKLVLTVERRGEVLFEGLLSEFEELAMGGLAAGAADQIGIKVHLPGAGSGNEYQGAGVTVKFAFRADCGGGGEDGSTLTVRKFHDRNENKVWDEGEPEITGWQVLINGTEYRTPVNRSFEPGAYIIREATMSGWRATTPVEVNETLGENEHKTVLFGNYQMGGGGGGGDTQSLTIQKFNDLDKDGVRDENEPYILGWKVTVNGVEYSTPVTFTQAGDYTITEETRAGWTASRPAAVEEALGPNEHKTVLFGNYQTGGGDGAALTVRKFNDLNRDGVWDGAEPEILDWLVTINGEEYATPVVLTDLAPGDYSITEGTRDGWVNSTPATVELTIAENGSETVLFGNYDLESITIIEEEPGIPPVETLEIPGEAPVAAPQTGEMPPVVFYAIGALLVLAGLVIGGRRYWPGKR